jgi:hypothetical protein
MSIPEPMMIAIPPDAYTRFCEHKIGQKHPEIEKLKGNQQAINRELARMWAKAVRNNSPEAAAFEKQADRAFKEDFVPRLRSEDPQSLAGLCPYIAKGYFGFAFYLYYTCTCIPIRVSEGQLWYFYHTLSQAEQAICEARGRTLAKILELCGPDQSSKILPAELFSYMPFSSLGNVTLKWILSPDRSI